MSGAVRPPWIDRATFLRTPFNFCDRWCERCELAEICRVFQKEQERRKRFIREGKNPDSWECVFEAIRESLKEIRELLEKQTKELGIDLEKTNAPEEVLPKPNKSPLYRLANKFSKALEKLMDDLQVIPVEADENLVLESLEIISHYCHFLPVKIYRALASKLEEEKEDQNDDWRDSQVSAFLVINALLEVSNALADLAEHEPLNPLKEKLLRLEKISLELVEIIRGEFGIEEIGP